MADTTEIAWCDSTFNPWIGCTKISTAATGGGGCDNCYAAAQDAFRKWTPEGWGGPRKRTSAANWRKPEQWNAEGFFECPACKWRGAASATAGFLRHACPVCFASVNIARRRVFCASLADVFDNQVPDEWRADLFRLIAATPNLDWLLLTKRIGNVAKMLGDYPTVPMLPNVWLGATIVNQEEADRDIPKLLATQAAVRFLSMEPLLGPVDLNYAFGIPSGAGKGSCPMHLAGVCPEGLLPIGKQHLHWVIVGGESGPGARPMHPAWARSLRDQCEAADLPFLFKQWGEWAPGSVFTDHIPSGTYCDFDGALTTDDERVWKVGKKAAGRLLDGVTHDGFPKE